MLTVSRLASNLLAAYRVPVETAAHTTMATQTLVENGSEKMLDT